MSFQVVKIVDEYLIVVDYGLKHNASEGDVLEVIKIGEEVFDPISEKSLGTLDLITGQVRVMNVYDNMSLCISNESVVVENPTSNSFASTLATLSRNFSHTETKALKVNTSQITGGYNRDKGIIIEIGDLVRIRKAKNYDSEDY